MTKIKLVNDMRIISQDGRIDLPYDQFALRVELVWKNTEEIYAINAIDSRAAQSGAGAVFQMAVYPDKDTAVKALEKLHTAFRRCVYTKGGMMTAVKAYAQPFGFVAPKVWRFPEVLEGDE
jgi:hypothetical protein